MDGRDIQSTYACDSSNELDSVNINNQFRFFMFDSAGNSVEFTNASGETLREYIYWGSQRVALVK